MGTAIWRMPSLFLLLLLLLSCEVPAYKLDQPRLLLPYTPSTSVRATLHVSDPVGGCFHWQSSRAHDFEVVPIEPRSGGCSDRAEVRTSSKVSGNVSAMIHAVDQTTRTRLSCEVRVDYISSIEILSTTNVIFVDAVPVVMKILARNSRGSAFSTLGSIPFEWEFSSGDDIERPVRIVPFSESEWEGQPEIVHLESEGKRGHSVLVEGLSTGSITLSARLTDSSFSKIPSTSLEVVVVANLQLTPSYTLYVPVHSVIPFQVQIIRQQTLEEVSMPSNQYYLHIDDTSVCSLDDATSTVTTLRKGKAEVALLSQNVNAKLQGVSPPSTLIHVTDPEQLRFAVNGGNWLLEAGRRYTIQVNLYDVHDNPMYISEGARFDTLLPSEYFTVQTDTKNKTHFEVTALKAGRTKLESLFTLMIGQSGKEVKMTRRVDGEQSIEIADPIEITPRKVVLPLFDDRTKKAEMQLKVEGGSGTLEWTSADEEVARVESTNGIVRTSERLGRTTVTARDRRNTEHSASVQVIVVEASLITIGETRVEVVEGGTLWLNVQLYANGEKGERLAITDCRGSILRVEVDDERIISVQSGGERRIPTEGKGCVSIPLNGITSGDAKVTVYLESSAAIDELSRSASQHISVYPALTSTFRHDRLILGLSSSYGVGVKGGPRPWIIDPSASFSRASVVNGVKASSSLHNGMVDVQCDEETGEAEVVVSVGNDPSPSNLIPAIETLRVKVCCALASRVVIRPEREGEGETRKGTVPACPAHTRSLFVNTPMRLALTGYGRCTADPKGGERQLHSISAMKVEWKSGDKKLLKLQQSKENNALVTAQPQGMPGPVTVTAAVTANLKASIDLRLFDKASASPSSIVLWNDVSAKGEVRLLGGSGHFIVKSATEEKTDKTMGYELKGDSLKISPRSVGSAVLRVHDLCIEDSVVEVKVKITDVQQIAIDAPNFVEVGRRVAVHLHAVDDTGESFPEDVAQLMDLQLTATGGLVTLEKVGASKYEMSTLAVGLVSLSATGRSSRSSTSELSSAPHSVQIFSPILLFPKLVTLVPESTFQLEVVGGPRPTPALTFSLNDSRLATVQSNSLIKSSTHLGYTTVTGSVEFGDGIVSKDSVVVRVVSLKGVRIVVSSAEVEKGTRLLARVEGLDETETPFAFGGAEYPLTIKWSLNDTDVFRRVSPFGESIREPGWNKYAIWLKAAETGVSSLNVRVQEHSSSNGHFASEGRIYEYTLELRSVSPLSLTTPAIETGEILLAPGGSLLLSSNWPSSTIQYRIPSEHSSIISVSRGGILSSLGPEGLASIEVIREGRAILASVQVVQPSTIDVRVSPDIKPATGTFMSSLPLGSTLKLDIILRDRTGREIHSSSPTATTLLFRPHRFDLTDIKGRNNNRTLTVRLMKSGETVLKIWDPSVPSLSTFVRLSCGDVIAPSTRQLVTSDIVCLRSPIDDEETTWSSDDGKVIKVLDGGMGVVQAVMAGSSHVHLNAAQIGLKMHTTLSVSSPTIIQFSSSSPSWVANLDDVTYSFPVIIGTNETIDDAQMRTSPSAIDCPASSVSSSLSSIRPPFYCSISFINTAQLGAAAAVFHVTPIFDVVKGHYACGVTKQRASSSSSLPSMETGESEVKVTANWVVDGKHLEATITASFHVAFSVIEEEITLTNYDRLTAILTIRVPSHLSSDIQVIASGDAVRLKELKSAPMNGQKTIEKEGGLKWIEIELNEKSDNLRDSCEVIVQSTKSGQTVKVPIRISLVGETAKRIYNDMGTKGFMDFVIFFISSSSHLIPSLMTVSVVLLIGVLIWRQITSSRVKYGVAAQHHNSSAFLSDPPPIDRTLSPSLDWSASLPDYSPQFRSTPRDALKRASPGGGKGMIFSTGEAADALRRRGGRFE